MEKSEFLKVKCINNSESEKIKLVFEKIKVLDCRLEEKRRI